MKKVLPLVSIVTVNYNGKHLLKDLFDSLAKLNYPQEKREIFLVDNGSRDGSREYVKKNYPFVKIIKNDINNYCRANNLGIKMAKGKYIAILNNDTKVDRDWLAELVKIMELNSRAGSAGSKILFNDGRIQSVGHKEFPYHYWGDQGLLEKDVQQYDRLKSVASVSNCSAFYRRKALDSVGVFDEDFIMYMEDVDMAFRLKKKKWRILYVPASRVYHRLHGSNQDQQERLFFIERNRLLFLAKHSPDKLPESLYGFGEIMKLKYVDFYKILIAVVNKLKQAHGLEKTSQVLDKLEKSLEIMDNYRQHSFKGELEKATLDIKQQLRSRDEQLKSHAEVITRLDQELKSRDGKLKDQDQAISLRDEQISRLDRELKAHDYQLEEQKERLKYLGEELQEKNNELNRKEKEIAKIYSSEIYRFFVRPLIWPAFFFIKTVIRLPGAIFMALTFIFTKHKNKWNTICIAQLSAKKILARPGEENEYLIKLANTGFKAQKIKLIVDIWPYESRSHPQRHFAYFAIEAIIKPRDLHLIKLTYDWGRNAVFFADGDKQRLVDFWRGEMKAHGTYLVETLVYNPDNRLMDKQQITQRLE